MITGGSIWIVLLGTKSLPDPAGCNKLHDGHFTIITIHVRIAHDLLDDLLDDLLNDLLDHLREDRLGDLLDGMFNALLDDLLVDSLEALWDSSL